MERRDFLKSAVAGGAIPLGAAGKGTLPRRKYRDDIELSVVGLGGIVVVGQEQKDADREVAAAIDRGVNYFDVAPSYGDGEAEIKLGNALRPYRKDVFLAAKTQKRDAAGAREELERSLERLHTDHVDLYQFHAVASMADVEKILGPRGAAETFMEAMQEGKVRYLGCSLHSVEAALAMLNRFKLDSVLFPINYVCFGQGDFGPQILAKAKEKGVARLALKSLARTRVAKDAPRKYPKCWYEPIDDRELARKALRFTLSEDITATIPPGDERIFRMALELAAEFQPLTAAERKELLAGAAGTKPIFPV